MKLSVLGCLISLCVLAASHAYATASSDLTSLLNAVQSMKGSFTQKVYNNKAKLMQTSYGQMAFERPGKFRWQVKKPIPQLVIANDKRLWIYDPDLEQVTIRTLKNNADNTPALLLSHTVTTLDNDFVVQEIAKNSPGWRWFKLSPRNKNDNMFAAVEMGFLKGQIKQMRLHDNLGHTTAVQFEDTQTNSSLPASMFVFKASKKVDVIDETRRR